MVLGYPSPPCMLMCVPMGSSSNGLEPTCLMISSPLYEGYNKIKMGFFVAELNSL